MKILLTGSAGFIGFHLTKNLLEKSHEVIGIDNLNSYYDVKLKESRILNIKSFAKQNGSKFTFLKCDLTKKTQLEDIFEEYKPEYIVNLAAQAGVRHSIKHPSEFINSNIVGFSNLLDICKLYPIKHLVFASSSSVYGSNKKLPFAEEDNVDHPISLYAATKKSNELMAHTYSALYNIPITGLRFFTVYGPWGRPDMALFLFTKSIIESKPIDVFNYGKMVRDFTYIDDIVESVYRVIKKPPKINNDFDFIKNCPSESFAPYKLFNIGNSTPTSLLDYISEIEKNVNAKAIINFKEIQPGDVPTTEACTKKLEEWISYKPNTPVSFGVAKFIDWYKKYYKC